jgi:hypothetical protein
VPECYRGVWVDIEGKVRYSRTYNKPGPAKAWVTSHRRTPGARGRPKPDFIEGWIERVTGWERVE